MGVHLIGGGRDEARCAPLLAAFVSEATDAAGAEDVVIALLLVLESDDDASVDRFRSLLIAAGAPPAAVRVEAIVEGERFTASAVDGAHGLFIGGGLTPAYHDAVTGIAEAIRARVAAGASYAGFSAGAAIAASRAIVGGYRSGGVVVSPEDAGEELEDIEVRDGLGLVANTIDVHAAQWGTLGRTVAAVTSGLTHRALAIDEYTGVVVEAGGEFAVRGEGHAWSVGREGSGVTVSMLVA